MDKQDKKDYDREYYQKNKEKIREYNRKYYEKNAEKIKKQVNNYRIANLEKINIKKKKYREKNKQKIKEHDKEYYENNKDKIVKKGKEYYENNIEHLKNKSRKYSKNNREKINKRARKYYKKKRKTDKNFNIRNRLSCLLRIALKTYTKTGKYQISKKYGIDWKKVIEHLKPFPDDIFLYHIDHRKPLCSFDLTNPEEIKIAFAPENHQWLLASENMSKGGKIENIK